MPRSLWSGAINFGLLNIPVQLVTAEERGEQLSFRLLDRRDHAPVGYKKINKATGEEVSGDDIVKGYEYEKDEFIILDDEDFEKSLAQTTDNLQIEDMVDIEDVDFMLFIRPYYLLPQKNSSKSYLLLKKALEKTRKAAIGKIVIRKKQHLAAILPRGDFLVLELLRFAHEVRSVDEMQFPKSVKTGVEPSEKEVEMAEKLIESLGEEWKPEKYKDDYYRSLSKIIQQKAETGEIKALTQPSEEKQAKTASNVRDLMPLLKESLKKSKKKAAPRKARKGS